jgi:uncharacterized membrane protein YfcA
MLQLLPYLALGAAAGLLSGLLGIGGGILMVPALVLLLGLEMKTAVGTSLAVIVPMALAGAGSHLWKGGALDWRIVAAMAAAGIGCAVLGNWLAHVLPALTLKRLFGVLMLVAGLRMMLARPSAPPPPADAESAPADAEPPAGR